MDKPYIVQFADMCDPAHPHTHHHILGRAETFQDALRIGIEAAKAANYEINPFFRICGDQDVRCVVDFGSWDRFLFIEKRHS